MDPKAIKKIKKLLALAFGSEGPEADNALAKAEAIAEKYGCDLESIDFESAGKGVSVAEGVSYYPESSSLWRCSLAWAVARYSGVQMIRHHRGKEWTIVGRPEDVSLWRSLFTRAEKEIDDEARRYCAALPCYMSKKSEGDTFRKGAASGFGQRLREWKNQAKGHEHASPEEKGTALVLAGRDALVAGKVKELFPRLKSMNVNSRGSNASWSEGRRFGSNMGVHRGNLK